MEIRELTNAEEEIMVSFFIEKNKLNLKEADEILKIIEKAKSRKK